MMHKYLWAINGISHPWQRISRQASWGLKTGMLSPGLPIAVRMEEKTTKSSRLGTPLDSVSRLAAPLTLGLTTASQASPVCAQPKLSQ